MENMIIALRSLDNKDFVPISEKGENEVRIPDDLTIEKDEVFIVLRERIMN